jgi:hypothetical protein
MADGSFDLRGSSWNFTLLNAEGYNGEEYDGAAEIEDHIEELDRIFYSVESSEGETFYRWVSGPYESLNDLEEAIRDETEEYE